MSGVDLDLPSVPSIPEFEYLNKMKLPMCPETMVANRRAKARYDQARRDWYVRSQLPVGDSIELFHYYLREEFIKCFCEFVVYELVQKGHFKVRVVSDGN